MSYSRLEDRVYVETLTVLAPERLPEIPERILRTELAVVVDNVLRNKVLLKAKLEGSRELATLENEMQKQVCANVIDRMFAGGVTGLVDSIVAHKRSLPFRERFGLWYERTVNKFTVARVFALGLAIPLFPLILLASISAPFFRRYFAVLEKIGFGRLFDGNAANSSQ